MKFLREAQRYKNTGNARDAFPNGSLPTRETKRSWTRFSITARSRKVKPGRTRFTTDIRTSIKIPLRPMVYAWCSFSRSRASGWSDSPSPVHLLPRTRYCDLLFVSTNHDPFLAAIGICLVTRSMVFSFFDNYIYLGQRIEWIG